MILYYKNQFIDSNQIDINQNLFNGIGIFETIKFTNNKILFFDEHMNRLYSNDFFDFTKLNLNFLIFRKIKILVNLNLDFSNLNFNF